MHPRTELMHNASIKSENNLQASESLSSDNVDEERVEVFIDCWLEYIHPFVSETR